MAFREEACSIATAMSMDADLATKTVSCDDSSTTLVITETGMALQIHTAIPIGMDGEFTLDPTTEVSTSDIDLCSANKFPVKTSLAKSCRGSFSLNSVPSIGVPGFVQSRCNAVSDEGTASAYHRIASLRQSSTSKSLRRDRSGKLLKQRLKDSNVDRLQHVLVEPGLKSFVSIGRLA